MRKRLLFGLSATVIAALVVATGALAAGPGRASRKGAVVQISTRKLPKLGTILVNSKGRTVYAFVPDKRKRVTCKGACVVVWPPVKLPTGAKPVAKGAVKAKLLGSDRDPAGGRVVTYNKWPLYTYVSDPKPGQALGQGLRLNGGLWYVLAPSGALIKKKVH